MKFDRTWIIAMMITLLTNMGLPASVVLDRGSHAEQRITEQGASTLQVIVQFKHADVDGAGFIAAVGGQITRDLPMINAVTAQVPVTAMAAISDSNLVRSVSFDAPVQSAGFLQQRGKNNGPVATDSDVGGAITSPWPSNHYLDTLNVSSAWAMGLDGAGIGVAVIDSGISPDGDLGAMKTAVQINPNATSSVDTFGHGTHVAGILAGNGSDSQGQIRGIAPGVNLLNLKVSDDQGLATESDVVAAMQWVLEHKDLYNIRVVNLSVNSTVEQSYHLSPLSAAAEILWFNSIVVVTATGNKSSANGFNPVLAAPANDPFVITVGASDEKGDTNRNNDAIAMFTAYDMTTDGFVKPDIMAPGVEIYSVLSKDSAWAVAYPDRVSVDGQYFRLSGASMSTPMVAGAVALLLQAEPHLTPDQVKYRLLHSAGKVGKAPYLDVQAMLTEKTSESANVGIAASQLLWSGREPVQWQSVNWNAVNWNAVNWNAVNWNAVNWNAVNWNSISWGE